MIIFLPDTIAPEGGQVTIHEEDIGIEVQNKKTFWHIRENAREDLLSIGLFFFPQAEDGLQGRSTQEPYLRFPYLLIRDAAISTQTIQVF